MKLASSKFVLPLLLASIAPVSGQWQWLSDVTDALLNNDQSSSKQETKDTVARDYVMQTLQENVILGRVFSNLGDYISGTGNAANEIAQGRRAYKCLMEDTENASVGRKFPFLQGAVDATKEAIAYAVLYHSFGSPEDIDVVCPEEDDDRERRTLAALKRKEGKNNLRRRAQILGATPNYPSLDPDSLFAGGRSFAFRNKVLSAYLAGDDYNDRWAISTVVNDLNGQIVAYQTTNNNLQSTGEIVYAVGELVSTITPEASAVVAGATLDIGATIRAIGTFMQATATATSSSTARRQLTVSQLLNHLSLIDSAEIEASYLNSEALMSKMAALEAKI